MNVKRPAASLNAMSGHSVTTDAPSIIKSKPLLSVPEEVADAGLIRIGAAVGTPAKAGSPRQA